MAGVEDLMIFKMREQAKKKPEEAKPQAETKIIQPPPLQPQVEVKPVVPQPPKPQQQMTEREKPKGAGLSFFGLGKPRKKEERAAQPKPAPAMQPVQEEVAQVQPTHQTVFAQPKPVRPQKASAKKKGKEELEQAKGRFCEWHPWRPAYAVCDYCHRPFCYEDIEETGTGYYCLEDLDKIATTYREEQYVKYSNLSLASAAMFLFSFVVFIYFASGQLVYIFTYAHTVGFSGFLANLNYSYGSALAGLVLTGLGMLAGVLVFIQSKRGFPIGLLAALGSVALFSYLFLESGTLYMMVVAAMSFVALVLLAYSKVSYQTEESMFSSPVSKPVDWSNPSRF